MPEKTGKPEGGGKQHQASAQLMRDHAVFDSQASSTLTGQVVGKAQGVPRGQEGLFGPLRWALINKMAMCPRWETVRYSQVPPR